MKVNIRKRMSLLNTHETLVYIVNVCKSRALYTWFKVIILNPCVCFTVILPLLYGNLLHNLFSSKFWQTWSNKLNSFPVFEAKSWPLSSITSMCQTTQYLFWKWRKTCVSLKSPWTHNDYRKALYGNLGNSAFAQWISV